MTDELHLTFSIDGASEQTVPLRAGSHHIGRASENEIAVPNPSLSRQHALLRVIGGVVVLQDLGSRNGTLYRGKRIREVEIHAGDAFRCGDVEFTLGRGARPTRQAPTPAARMEDRTVALRSLLTQHGQKQDPFSSLMLKASGEDERARQKLQVLIEVGKVLSSPGTLDAVLPRVLDLLFQVFDVDRASLVLRDDDGRPRPRLTRVRSGETSTEAIHSGGILDEALRSAAGVLASDAKEDPRFAEAASVQIRGIRSAMCAPLRVRDTMLGALYVDHLSVTDRYRAEDLDFLDGFASQTAVAIENARLYDQLEQEAVRRAALSRFFPPTVLGPVLQSRDFGLVPQDLDVAVLFSDISGFTSMSSTMPPRDVVRILNRYFPVMAEIVFRHEGTLERYIGDALMAIWGAPAAHADDADRCLRAALEMRRALTELNRDLPRPLEIHVGLNAGPVAFGNIGSPEYQQFAAIGDATNVASRVCSLAGNGEILISETLRARLKDNYDLEALEPARVKGKEEPLRTYRVRG